MWHLLRNNHGNFHHAAHLAVTAPWRLIDHFLDALLVDGVTVNGVGGNHVTDFLLRFLAVAWHEVLTQHGSALLVKGST